MHLTRQHYANRSVFDKHLKTASVMLGKRTGSGRLFHAVAPTNHGKSPMTTTEQQFPDLQPAVKELGTELSVRNVCTWKMHCFKQKSHALPRAWD